MRSRHWGLSQRLALHPIRHSTGPLTAGRQLDLSRVSADSLTCVLRSGRARAARPSPRSAAVGEHVTASILVAAIQRWGLRVTQRTCKRARVLTQKGGTSACARVHAGDHDHAGACAAAGTRGVVQHSCRGACAAACALMQAGVQCDSDGTGMAERRPPPEPWTCGDEPLGVEDVVMDEVPGHRLLNLRPTSSPGQPPPAPFPPLHTQPRGLAQRREEKHVAGAWRYGFGVWGFGV